MLALFYSMLYGFLEKYLDDIFVKYKEVYKLVSDLKKVLVR